MPRRGSQDKHQKQEEPKSAPLEGAFEAEQEKDIELELPQEEQEKAVEEPASTDKEE